MTSKRRQQKKTQRRGLDTPPTPVSATVESSELPDVTSPLSRPAFPHPTASPPPSVTPPASIDGVSEQSPVAEAGLATPPPEGSRDESADGEQGQSLLDQQTEAAAEAKRQPSATAEDTHAEGSHEPEHGDVPPDQEAQGNAEPGQQAANGEEEQTPTNAEDGSLVGPIEHESRKAEPGEPEIADADAEPQATESQEDNEEGNPHTPIASGDSEEQTQSEPQLDGPSSEAGAVDDVPITGEDGTSFEGDSNQIAVGEQSTEDPVAEDDPKTQTAPENLEHQEDELQDDGLPVTAEGQDQASISKTEELEAERQAEVVGDSIQTPSPVIEIPEANDPDEGQFPAADDATPEDDLPTSGEETSAGETGAELVAGAQVDEGQALHQPSVNLTPVEPALEDNQLADDGDRRAVEVEQPYEQIVTGGQAQMEETQLRENAGLEPTVEDNREPEAIHEQTSAADAQQANDEAQTDPVDAGDIQDPEEAQEQSDNDQFFDSLEPEPDVEDPERTPTQPDHAVAANQEQTEQSDAFKHDYGTQAAEYPEEEDATLYDSPTDPGAYALQIIIEQPEEDAIWSPLPEQEQYDQPSVDPQDDASQRDAFPYGEAYRGDAHDQETTEEMQRLRAGTIFDISAKDVASRDLLAVADLFANMKSALTTMTSAFDRLGAQTEKMVALGLDVKAAQQLQQIKATLQSQISRHTTEVDNLKSSLQARIKEAVEAKIRDRLQSVIQNSIRAAVEERVREELSVQIPEDLRKQVISHKRQILEVKTTLHNSEARRYNALQTMPDLNAPLRPLLRPLPTPEQSPVVISISRSSSMGYSTLPTPATAFPQGPAPTPIRRSASNPYRSLTAETVPPSPSPFFPRDMTTLFALNPEETKRLLREYGLTSAVASPAAEHPTRARGLSIVNEDAAEEDPDMHARDLNKFMAHIGVPFLMIPAPKEKHHESAPLSSKSRRRLLTPLIIK